MVQLQRCKSAILRRIFKDCLKETYKPNEANSLVGLDNKVSDQILVYGYHIQHDSWNEAEKQLDTLLLNLDTFGLYDFVEIQRINIEYLKSKGSLIIDNEDEEFILSVATSIEPMAAFARAFYYEITKQHVIFDLPSIPSELPETRSLKRDINQNELKVFPNPSNDIINIVSRDKKIEQISLQDLNGTTKLIQNNLSTKMTKLVVSDFTSGIYFLKVKLENGKVLLKKTLIWRRD